MTCVLHDLQTGLKESNNVRGKLLLHLAKSLRRVALPFKQVPRVKLATRSRVHPALEPLDQVLLNFDNIERLKTRIGTAWRRHSGSLSDSNFLSVKLRCSPLLKGYRLSLIKN